MLEHKTQSAPQEDTWSPNMAFLTSVIPQCTMPGSDKGQCMFLTLACSWACHLSLCSTEKDFAVKEKAQLKQNFLCFVVVFHKNGRSSIYNVTI